MGSAKLPEQITERFEAGTRAIAEESQRDPEIEKLKARPVTRKIETEENNVRRGVKTVKITVGLISIRQKLKIIRQKLDNYKTIDLSMYSNPKAVQEEIVALKRLAARLQKRSPPPKSRRRHKKH